MKLLRASIAVLLVGAASGCAVDTLGRGYVGGWDRSISNDTAAWGRYEPGETYRLVVDVFLLDMPDKTNGTALVPGMDFEAGPGGYRGPSTIATYERFPDNWRWVTGIVRAETKIRATRLRAKGNLRAPDRTVEYPKGEILDGEFRGRVVDMQPLSAYRMNEETGDLTLLGPDARFLAPAE
jgi:hypothetical protein